MSGCTRCGTTVEGSKGAVAACGTWAGEDAAKATRRLRFWNLALCAQCLNQAYVDSQEPKIADAYSMMQVAPFALAFGVLGLYVLLDPDNGDESTIEGMMIMLMLVGGYAFGVLGAWYFTWRFHRLRGKARRQRTQPVPEANTIDGYGAEAERICSALKEQHSQSSATPPVDAAPAIAANFRLPMPKGVGEPYWEVIGVADSRIRLQQLIAQTDSDWRTALKIAEREDAS